MPREFYLTTDKSKLVEVIYNGQSQMLVLNILNSFDKDQDIGKRTVSLAEFFSQLGIKEKDCKRALSKPLRD